ncbi:MAG: flippase-like domain-containing protein [Planctomycetia bacterium]|nr:MAG: flippase-like domain-containing protein [Planctomycetia bacterium]
MSAPKRGRWLLLALRLALCAVALVYLYFNVKWNDYVQLNEPPQKVRLFEQGDDTLEVQLDGQRRTIPRASARELPGKPGEIEIIPGLRSVLIAIDGRRALLAILLFMPVPLLSALRLVWMLAIQGVRLRGWDATKLTFVGNFFNFALPGTTGGDLIKAYYITRFTAQKTEAVTTVFLDRVVGLLGLVILAGGMMAISWDGGQFGRLAMVIGAVCAGLAVLAAMVMSKRLRHLIRLPQLAARLPAGEHLLRVGRSFTAMRSRPTMVLAALLLTVLLQACVMVSAYFMALALGMKDDFVRYFIYVPIGFLIAAIPVSPPQAFGVMEWAYIQFFANTGMSSASQAVTFALAVRAIQLVWALPGVLVPLLGAHLPRRDQLAELETAAPPSAGGDGDANAAGHS